MHDILVFHDDVAIRDMLYEACTLEGYTVTRTSTVEETLAALRTAPHRLIVLAERDHSSHIPVGRSSRASATIPTSMGATTTSPSTGGSSRRRRLRCWTGLVYHV